MKGKFLAIILISFLMIGNAFAQLDFVAPGNADFLIVTHQSLRTPGWYPGMTGAWETEILELKDEQELDVAIYAISNGTTRATIKSWIETNAGQVNYIFIIGDAHTPDSFYDNFPNNPWPVTDISGGNTNYVPFWGDQVTSDLLYWGEFPLEWDGGYIQNLSDCVIGRLPAASRAEILNYLSKVNSYLSNLGQNWGSDIGYVVDNQAHAWNSSSPDRHTLIANSVIDNLPGTWSASLLTTEDIPSASRESSFESLLNNHCGLLVTHGTAANSDNFSMFYFGTSNYNLTNTGYYPFVLGANCDIGNVQQDPPGGDPNNLCVLEKLMVMSNGGVIGGLAPTNWSRETTNMNMVRAVVGGVTNGEYVTYGDVYREAIHSAYSSEVSWNPDIPEFTYQMYNLFGDPTLPLANVNEVHDMGIVGNVTWDEPVYYVTSTLSIATMGTLTIAPGTRIVARGGDPKVYLDVYGKLIADGTTNDPVIFESNNPSQRWGGIKIYTGADPASSISYCEINDGTYGVYTEVSLANGNPIEHCSFENDYLPLYFNAANADLEYCDIDGGFRGIHIQNSSADREWVHIDINEMSSCGVYAYNALIDLRYSTVQNVSSEGLYLSNADDAYLYHIEMTTCGDDGVYARNSDNMSLYFVQASQGAANGAYYYNSGGYHYKCQFNENASNGVLLAGSSPRFNRCNIIENTNHGIYCLSSSQPVLTYRNHLQDNGGRQVKSTYHILPMTYNGNNNIFTTGPLELLMETTSTTIAMEYGCINNYWGQFNPVTCFDNFANPGYFTFYYYEPYATTPYDNGLNYLSSEGWADSPLYQAMNAEAEGNLEEARRLLLDVIATPEDQEQLSAAVLHSTRMIGNDHELLQQQVLMLQSLISRTDENKGTRKAYENALAYCLQGLGRYEEAVQLYLDHHENALTLANAVLAEINIRETYLSMAENASAHTTHRTLRSTWDFEQEDNLTAELQMIPVVEGTEEYKPVSRSEHQQKVQELLDMLEAHPTAAASNALPEYFALHQNFPNPFNPATNLRFDLPDAVDVTIRLYNLMGQEVRTIIDQRMDAGYHQVTVDLGRMASGVYFVQMEAGSFSSIRKMILMK